jgi:predicted nucleic acid-binding protein
MLNLLDTSALLAHYRGEKGAERVQALFAEEDEEILGVEDTRIRHVIGEYQELAHSVVAVDATVAETSDSILRATPSRLPLVDALIAAAARVTGARLVHRDSHMRAIPAALLEQLDLDAE